MSLVGDSLSGFFPAQREVAHLLWQPGRPVQSEGRGFEAEKRKGCDLRVRDMQSARE